MKTNEKNSNAMPLTFVIIPSKEVGKEGPKKSSNVMGMMSNAIKRKSSQLMSLVWDKSKLIFICPVTLQQVLCIIYDMTVLILIDANSSSLKLM